jgi:hypothetical protein
MNRKILHSLGLPLKDAEATNNLDWRIEESKERFLRVVDIED